MSLLTILRAAAIIGGFIWGLYIIAGWYALSLVYSYRLNSFDFFGVTSKAVEVLLVQTLADVVLLLFGFFGGSNKAANSDRIFHVRNHAENLQYPDHLVDEIDSRKCPECAETIKAAARVCRFCKSKVQPRTGIFPY